MEPSGNTETEDETVALAAKKTPRRVSFADNEITSVHLFPTDDAEQTPPLDADNDVVSSPFLMPTASPPPSSIDDVDSFAEEEAFRAPVSASFIAPGRFSGSDSGFSDDLTMDSTAFSLHYKSLARSDSADLRTPSQTSVPTTTTGSFFMTLSKAKGQFSGSSVRTDGSASGARDSNDMSVVEGDENPFRYDYHRISHSLDAILAEGSKNARSVSEPSNRSGYVLAKGNDASIVRSPGSLIINVLKRKHDESPAKGVIVASNCIQGAPTPSMTFLQARLSELRRCSMQELCHKGNLDGNDFHAEISSGKKRKGYDYEILRDGDRVDEIGRIDTSLHLHKGRKSDQPLLLEGTGDMRSEKEKLGDQTIKTWTDIVKDFLWGTKQLLSPSVDKLNLRAIGVLEDILVHLQKVSICEAFCSETHSQKIADPLNIPRHKRFAEAKSLLFNIAYGKAKLQLMHIKHERLLKKLQLSSQLPEFQMMKLNDIPSKHEAVDKADDSHFHSILLSSEANFQVSCEKVTTMRRELENLEWKAKSLNKSFHTYCKVENHQSLADTIISVHDYLKERISCGCIFRNLQLWDVADFEHVDGCYRVVLNYYGYIIQRFTVNACPSPSTIISNKLNDVEIVKTFPDIDALFAFMFVFNPHTTKKCTDTKGLAQETQVTSSLLTNLLDVIEEVQLTRIETRNMIQAKFYSESVGQLDLLLSFIDFCSGKKVKMTLDMTCLRCGVYPVETLPYRIYDPASGEQKSSSLVAEIRTAVKGVRVGYSRIMRICRCISQAVQACTLSL